jgi:MFS family permease
VWRRVAFAMFAVGWGANQFSPMLLVYHRELSLTARTQDVLFGVYALGLVPALLLGGRASDRYGRRPLVLAFLALSPLASLILVLGRHSELALGAGRLLAGACSGVVFSAAAAWVQELSAEGAARRAAIALSAGFGSGPLGAALVAQWAPHPLWTPYLLHIALGLAALAVALPVPETVAERRRGALWTWPRAARTRRFRLVVAPMAPWVFGLASAGCVVLPRAIGGRAIAFAGVVNALTLWSGVAVQPLARRLEERRAMLAAFCGLALGTAALAVAALVLAHAAEPGVLLVAVPLGAAYGLILVGGLHETERLARPDERAATIAVFLALTYVGFGLPYLVSALGGDAAALAALAVAMAACLALTFAARTRPVAAR